jgi:hypothetical protein
MMYLHYHGVVLSCFTWLIKFRTKATGNRHAPLRLRQVAAGSTTRIPGLPDIPVVNTQAALSDADIVILAVPSTSHKAIAKEYGHLLSGKVVVDVSNPHTSEDLSVPDKALDDTESDVSTSGVASGCQHAAAKLCGVSSKGCAAVRLSSMLPVSPYRALGRCMLLMHVCLLSWCAASSQARALKYGS